MKKVMIAFDGEQFSEGAFEFARQLHAKSPLLLLGVFVPQIDYANLWSYAVATGGPMFIPAYADAESEETRRCITRFEAACTANNIRYIVHSNYDTFTLQALKKESRFSDLLLIGSQTFYQSYGMMQPNEYLRDLLHEAECPAVVVPEQCSFPTKNIIAYDGSPAAVFAMKQFAYLFPELAVQETLLVNAQPEPGAAFPCESYVKELAARHFPRFSVFTLQAEARKYFSTWIAEQKGALLVTGSYGRSTLSELFKKSFVSEVIRDRLVPLFVAHQ